MLLLKTVQGKMEPHISCAPFPGHMGEVTACLAAGGNPITATCAPFCSHRMLARKEEMDKFQLQTSGNLFIKEFMELLARWQPAENIRKQYMEKVSASPPT